MSGAPQESGGGNGGGGGRPPLLKKDVDKAFFELFGKLIKEGER